MNRSAVDREVTRLGPWFHNLHLPDGVETAPTHPLGDFPLFKWQKIAPSIPEDLHSWRVLDIGCNAGFYTFELAKRGADVLGIDIDERYLDQARWAAAQYGLSNRVRFRRMQVYELARLDERFDLIWFMGVFYHLRYPLLALDAVARMTGRKLVFQTMTLPGDRVSNVPADLGLDDRSMMRKAGWPVMAFIENSLAGDPTNWWAANHACVEAMLRSAGLRILERPAHEVYICEPSETKAASNLIEREFLAASGRSNPLPRTLRKTP